VRFNLEFCSRELTQILEPRLDQNLANEERTISENLIFYKIAVAVKYIVNSRDRNLRLLSSRTQVGDQGLFLNFCKPGHL